MNLREIDGVTWCDVKEVIPGLDILEEYIRTRGCYIAENFDNSGTLYLFDKSGEALYSGSTLRALLVNIILGG